MQTEPRHGGWFQSDVPILSLPEVAHLVRRQGHQICGFVVSQAFVDRIKATVETVSDPRYAGVNSISGIPFVVDPDFGPAQMEVATSREAWQRRVEKIAGR